MLNFWRSCRDL